MFLWDERDNRHGLLHFTWTTYFKKIVKSARFTEFLHGSGGNSDFTIFFKILLKIKCNLWRFRKNGENNVEMPIFLDPQGFPPFCKLPIKVKPFSMYILRKIITLNQKSSLASRFHHCRRLVERGSSLLRCFKLIPIFIIVGTFKSSSWGGLSHLPSNEFITCFHESCIYDFFSQNFMFYFLEGCKVSFSVMKQLYLHFWSP